MEEIEFSNNYRDHSTETGFQFEFYCNRCNNGYRTSFQPWAAGTVSGALNAASSLFGGAFGRAANAASQARSATWQQARDGAFRKSIAEIRPAFIQCPRCQRWVCRKRCWNEARGLCKDDAPDLATEISAQQSAMAVEQIRSTVTADAADAAVIGAVGTTKMKAACPNCGTAVEPGAKFCGNCGHKLDVQRHCTNCGAPLANTARFCAECGTPAA
jgi:predicted nucleic acid-binding Zn ribbon protein